MRFTLLLLLPVFFLSTTSSAHRSGDDPEHRFREAGVKGCFVLCEIGADQCLRINPERCARQFTPASTFKILNSLVSLESGAVAGLDDTLRWDGRRHSIASWNQDQCMRDAFQRSCVWFYQELARRVGEERMRKAVDDAGYGNRDIGGGIDRFWLDGALRISADEQAEFLRKLWNETLAFRAETQLTVKDLMLLERNDRYTLRGKTGTAIRQDVVIGWLVGYVEQNGRVWVYVLNMEEPDDGDLGQLRSRRLALARNLLQDQGLL